MSAAGRKVARDVTIWIVSSRGMESLGWAEETGNKTSLGPSERLVVLVDDYTELRTQRDELRKFFDLECANSSNALQRAVVAEAQRDALEAREKVLREALLGIEVIEHGSEWNNTKEVWFLLRSDGDKIGAGSVHLTGEFAKAMSLWAAKRRAALATGAP